MLADQVYASPAGIGVKDAPNEARSPLLRRCGTAALRCEEEPSHGRLIYMALSRGRLIYIALSRGRLGYTLHVDPL